MASGSLSPIPVKSPSVASSNDRAKKSSSSPTPSSTELAATGNSTSYDLRTDYHHHHNHRHHHHRHHRHHHSERDDRSLSPSHRRSSRYDERHERRISQLAPRYPQDRHYAPEPPISRRDYRDIDDQRSQLSRNDDRNGDDSYRRTPLTASESPVAATTATEAASSSSRHHGDSYRPTPLPPSESTSATPSSSSSSRHHDQYQTRYEESRYDRMGRRDDCHSDYSRRHPSSYHSSSSQHQHPEFYYRHERSPYSHREYRTREPIQHHHEPYDDRHYERYNSRYHSTRRIIDRGTEEERQKSTTIFAGNLSYDFGERDVAAMFERYGKLVKITIPIDSMTKKNKGFAFVEFERRHEAQEAFDNFQGFSVGGRRLKLDWDIGLQKKDARRTPRFEDYQRPMSLRSSSTSSPPPRNDRDTDTYIPSRSQV